MGLFTFFICFIGKYTENLTSLCMKTQKNNSKNTYYLQNEEEKGGVYCKTFI